MIVPHKIKKMIFSVLRFIKKLLLISVFSNFNFLISINWKQKRNKFYPNHYDLTRKLIQSKQLAIADIFSLNTQKFLTRYANSHGKATINIVEALVSLSFFFCCTYSLGQRIKGYYPAQKIQWKN